MLGGVPPLITFRCVNSKKESLRTITTSMALYQKEFEGKK
jgi:hypothetical protein